MAYDDPKLSPQTWTVDDLDVTVDGSDGGRDDVKAHTTTGLRGEHLGGGDPRSEDQLEGLLLGEPADVHTSLGRGGPHGSNIDAGAVIAYRDHDLRSHLCRMKPHRCLRRLAGGQPNLRELDSVSHGVSNQVQKWRDQLFEDTPVDLDILAEHLPTHVLAGSARGITHCAMEDWLQRRYGHHARPFGDLLELVDHLGQFAVFGDLIGVQPKLGAEDVSHSQLSGRRLADKAVELIDSRHRDLERRRIDVLAIRLGP